MNDRTPEIPPQEQQLNSYWLGQELNWDAISIPVILFVELPYWIMTSDCSLKIETHGYTFEVEIRSELFEVYVQEVQESRIACVYIGPDPNKLDPEILKDIDEQKLSVLPRKCKTVLRIHTKCNEDVLLAMREEGKRPNEAHMYLRAFCEAHIKVINTLVQSYRLSTYDFFPYEVSPWDVSVWFVETNSGFIRVELFDYVSWDYKPVMFTPNGSSEVYSLISPSELQESTVLEPSAGEIELLDAINFMERGNYSDAVRRITTAIEAILESVLRKELLKHHTQAEVETKLHASRNDFPGRLRQYQKLSRRILPTILADELDITRNLRHSIVHHAFRISFNERGRAQRAVDTGRWIYNWFENKSARSDVREKQIAMRSLGRHFSLFNAEIDSAGVVVYKPSAM